MAVRHVDRVATTPVLQLKGIYKAYPGVQALKGVDFEVAAGEVHALVGANGAGKSTLVKVIGGSVSPDAGTLHFKGHPVALASSADGIRLGIIVVHQERTLIPHLTGAENILLGHEPGRLGIIHARLLREQALALSRQFQLEVPLEIPVQRLGEGERQLIDLLKALSRRPAVLVLDEPTAALSIAETERLFALIARLKASGIGILFVSHRLDEVFRIADRITVLRDGVVAGTGVARELTPRDVVRLMVNRDLEQYERRTLPAAGTPAPGATGAYRAAGVPLLETVSLSGQRFSGVSIRVYPGEVVGLAGIVGSGRTELLETLVGFRPASGGSLRLEGRSVSIRSPRHAVALGLALVPERRSEKSLFERLVLRENLSMPVLRRFSRRGIVRRRAEVEATGRIVQTLRIVAPGPEVQVRNLSGGNKQKVSFGKWLVAGDGQSGERRLFLFDEPTEGVDVSAKVEIWGIIRELAHSGAGVLFASSELDEVVALSDRVYVMRAGRVVREVTGAQIDQHYLLHWMLGVEDEEVPAPAGPLTGERPA